MARAVGLGIAAPRRRIAGGSGATRRVASGDQGVQVGEVVSRRELARFKTRQRDSARWIRRGQHGGTGQTFDWELARRAKSHGAIILAGGLTPENSREAIRVAQPYAVDVASGVEARPGKKDPARLRALFARGRNGERAEERTEMSYDRTSCAGRTRPLRPLRRALRSGDARRAARRTRARLRRGAQGPEFSDGTGLDC